MKTALFFILILCISVALSHAEVRCHEPPRHDCRKVRYTGRGGHGCHTHTMWYYKNGQCHSMQYLGCGGNANRYCSKALCERTCHRSG